MGYLALVLLRIKVSIPNSYGVKSKYYTIEYSIGKEQRSLVTISECREEIDIMPQ